MRKLSVLLFIAAALSSGCKEKYQEVKTALYYFTPYQDSPEYLNGQLKSVKESNYWAVEKNGQFTPGNLLTQKERDSVQWSGDFTAFYSEAGIPEKVDIVSYNWKTNSWVTEIIENLIVKATWIRLDTPRSYYTFSYDANKKHIGSLGYRYSIDTVLQKIQIANDDNGRVDVIKYFNWKDVLIARNNYKWNAKSLVSEVSNYNGTDSLTGKSKVEYNEKGFYTRAEYLDGKGVVTRTLTLDYKEYDDHGNWLYAITYDNGKPLIYTKREYEYYQKPAK